MKDIFNTDSLDELKKLLETKKNESTRKSLIKLLLKYVDYKNVSEWNKAVTVCEALAIIGWGEYEPIQAIRGKFFNGNPETRFINKLAEKRFVDAIWSKRKDGFTMEQGRTSYHLSPLLKSKPTVLWDYSVTENIQNINIKNQRNWIPTNPLYVNAYPVYYPKFERLVLSINKKLKKQLENTMNPKMYGNAIQNIFISISFSYEDTNYIIADKSVKVKTTTKLFQELQKSYTAEEIYDKKIFLRHRYQLGNFKKNTGKGSIDIHFEEEFGNQDYTQQVEKFSIILKEAVKEFLLKLKKKKLNYNLELMYHNFETILNEWAKNET